MATPAAPTNLIEDNANNIVSFTPNPDYDIEFHEFSIDNGVSWTDCTSSTISVPEIPTIPVGHFQVRVKATTGGNSNQNSLAVSTGALAGAYDSVDQSYVLLNSAITLAGDFEIRCYLELSSISTDNIICGSEANAFLRIGSGGGTVQTRIDSTFTSFTLSETLPINTPFTLIVRRIGGTLYIFKDIDFLASAAVNDGSFIIDTLMYKGATPDYLNGKACQFDFYDTGTLVNGYRLNEVAGVTCFDYVGAINGAIQNPTANTFTNIDASNFIEKQVTKVGFASDFHYKYSAWDQIEGVGGLSSEDRAKLAIDAINSESLDYVFLNGDLTQNNDAAFMPSGNDIFKEYIDNEASRLNCAYGVVNSSHDYYTDAQWNALFSYQKNYIVEFGNTAFVVIDNWSAPTTDAGGYEYSQTDISFLTASMDSLTAKKAVYIVSHYIEQTDPDEADTLALLATYANYKGVIRGHIHNVGTITVGGKPWMYNGHFSVAEGGAWINNIPWTYRLMEIDEHGLVRTYIVKYGHTYPYGTQAREIIEESYITP